ncbi:methyl-accepting chemotaxis sensory transducer [Marinobacter santoriniensis NKSG1]|uniref:Methyl-accepting chemotaxis sensory transducer n=1 Tax=Marinobacter santoriniensis NKSG1 TaxID=1288826 RepID=M7CT00_9GAMM|nr:methyl-accepting chemotaxis protein [Marinobacter santoriniensis]EMP56274.1 methyl-accepting chemotaxis sensory transducer [Marinobacter santoriniensis NKSG1]
MSIRLKVILLSTLSLLLALLISGLALFGSDRVMEQSLRFNEATRVTQNLAQALARATTTIKADPILPETASLLEKVNNDLQERFASARAALADNRTPEVADAIDSTATAWDDYYQQSVELNKMAETDPASALGMVDSVYQSRFVPLQSSFKNTISLASTYSDTLAAGIAQNLRAQRTEILLVLGGSAILLVILVTIVLVRMKRSVAEFQGHSAQLIEGDLTSRFQDSGKDEISEIGRAVNHFLELFVGTLKSVRTSADQSDSVVMNLRQVTGEADRNIAAQADETRQMREAVEQLSLSFREVAEKSAQASDTAAEGEQIVARGNAMGETNRDALESIDSTVAATSTMVEELSAAINEVASVTRAIHDISEQTTLLALNAAIEAARAGSHGRGFAVVADEVKQLSDRTRSLTSDIAGIVDTVQNSTGKVHDSLGEARQAIATGVESGHSMSTLLGEMNHSIQDVAAMLREVAASTEEQSTVATDINHRIERVASGGEQMQSQMASVLTVIARLEQANTDLNHHLSAFRTDAPDQRTDPGRARFEASPGRQKRPEPGFAT